MEENKFSAFLEFGTVYCDSNFQVDNCVMPVAISKINTVGKAEKYSFHIQINNKMDVGKAISFALARAKEQFLQLQPDAEFTKLP